MIEGAACEGLPQILFFEGYDEVNELVDELCFNCPFRKQCLELGVKHPGKIPNTGVFGGVYLVLGKYSYKKNKHKTEAQRKQLIQEIEEMRNE